MKAMGILKYQLAINISNVMQVTTREMKAFQHFSALHNI